MMDEALVAGRMPTGRSKPLTGIEAALANTQLFSQCSRKELKTVAKTARVRTIKAGARLMSEGESAETMYAIVSGIARVSRNGRKVATLGAGDAVGELALIGRTERNASVDAETDLEVAEINGRELRKLIASVPSFAQKLLEALAARVRELDKRVFP
jgi:CRP-like cAMP-binding protein